MQSIFSPALYIQRHQFVIDYVRRNKPRKVADLGCGECQLLRKLTFQPDISLLVGVDINGALVKKKKVELGPSPADYLQLRHNQLRVELYQGSVTQNDSRLRGFDLVTSIELIEHLTLDDVESFSANLFGYMRPATVIVSTPNSEYNRLLPGLRGFRHRDHKFEWTRAEFRSWAQKVCCDYGYEVEFTGVGQAPLGLQHSVGFCTQIAVFHRLGGRDRDTPPPDHEAEGLSPYEKVESLIYPSVQSAKLHRLLLSEVFSCAKRLTIERPHEERPGQAGDVQTACGEKGKNPWKERGGVVSEDKDKAEEALPTIGQITEERFERQRCVSLPLETLWSRCPKISVLCGSLRDLRSLLRDQPKVVLNPEGSALIVDLEDQGTDSGEDEEEAGDTSEDSGCAAEARLFSHDTHSEEDEED